MFPMRSQGRPFKGTGSGPLHEHTPDRYEGGGRFFASGFIGHVVTRLPD